MKTHSTRRLYTTRDYHQMADDGLLRPEERVELIEGVIIPMSPIRSRHAGCVKRVSAMFHRRLGKQAVISTQDPITLNRFSEPQPDVAVVRSRSDFYSERHPTAEDVLLLVEVADTSLVYDRHTKLPLYARAGIPEVWLVDLPAEIVEVHRQPAFRRYVDVASFGRGRSLRPSAFPQVSFRVSDVLGAKR